MDVASTKRMLTRSAGFARRCEDVILPQRQEKPLQMVTYSMLIAQRRFALAVRKLDVSSSYEARVLVRSMLEHYYNLSWMRLRAPHRRANRFMCFHVIERLRMMQELPEDMRPADYAEVLADLKRRRAAYRHLFQRRDRRGVLSWDKSWCGGLSFEARVTEVQRAARVPNRRTDPFMYVLYRWFSGTTHGSAQHFSELLRATPRGVRPLDQPDRRPAATMLSASLFLLGTLSHASQVLNFSDSMNAELGQLTSACFKAVGPKLTVNQHH